MQISPTPAQKLLPVTTAQRVHLGIEELSAKSEEGKGELESRTLDACNFGRKQEDGEEGSFFLFNLFQQFQVTLISE